MTSFSRKRRFYILAEHRQHFLHSQWAGGVILLFCSIIAIVLSNLTATQETFHHFWMQEFTIGFENLNLTSTLEEWVNDGLMVIFFFAVGLEIKREIIAGQLSSLKQAGLPIAAAVGGMIVPALTYLIFNAGKPTAAGWGTPMATDIAFALGVLSLLGKKVPFSLKIFLTAMAIVDDLGAILVIALFYSSGIQWGILIAAGVVFAFLILLNKLKVYSMKYYLLPSILLWILFLHSGIHATISGVIIALIIPTTPRFSKSYFMHKAHNIYKHLYYYDQPHVEILANQTQYEYLDALRKIARNAISPTQRLENALHSTVTFFIMPLFALANAGVVIDFSHIGEVFNSQTAGIFFGLVVGKPLGICLFCMLVVRLGWCVMPSYVTRMQFLAVACLGGIGFTMSIFVNNLAFTDPVLVANGKIAILCASITAGLIGWAMIRLASRLRGYGKRGSRYIMPTEEE